MRGESSFHDDDDGVLTTVFWHPTGEAVAAPPAPSYEPVRSYEVEDRYAIPTPLGFSPVPALAPRATREQTMAVRRRVSKKMLIGTAFTALCVLVGVTIGGVIVLTGHASSTAHAAPAAPPKPAPTRLTTVTAPVIAPIAVAAPAPKSALVTLRVESNPPGATATLVDGDKNTLVGVTPVDASIDGSHAYDIVLTLENHDTQIVHVDPATQKNVSVTLAASVVEMDPPPAPVLPARHHRAAPVVHDHARPVAVIAPPVETGTGTLVVSSKPPTSIIVDGKPTGLTTPQRSLAISAGHHEITLTNASEGISLTTEVDITADHATRLVQDFTK